jgi:uroporphyrinogen-III decarboxylase
MDSDWTTLSREQKRARRFGWYSSTERIRFDSPEAEKAYRVRAQRMIDVYDVREPDRVPVSLPIGSLPVEYAGIDYGTAMYDAEKAAQAWLKFSLETDLDAFAAPNVPVGKVLDLLDYRLYRWPGHGIARESPGYQFVESEYMTADEYDALINDPSDFFLRTYLPRIFGTFEPFRLLQSFTAVTELPMVTPHFMAYTRPEVQESLQKLIEVGKALASWTEVVKKVGRRGRELGFPSFVSVYAKAPFDTIGDTLRGTKGIILDMRRRPDKLLEALEVVAKITIDVTVETLNASKGQIALFPLHKGADGWMSEKQFDTFYWPTLKRVVDGLIEEGIMPTLFAEGGFETRLARVNEFPKGAVNWLFDRTDMGRAKQALGDRCCISGNVPASLIATGSPGEVKDYCRKVIETCKPGGGFILAAGTNSVEGANIANLRAMVEAAAEYGVCAK